MKCIVTLIDGREIEITGDVVANIYAYFTPKEGTSNTLPLGWVATKNKAVNFNHAILVNFVEDDEMGDE